MTLSINIIIFILGLSGLWVSKHIRDHKVKQTPLVCMIGFDCHAVVHSDYSRFFGVPVELAGMMYYAFVSLFYFLSIFAPKFFPSALYGFFMIASCAAFLFSLYLVAVQIFILKKGCSWCIVSALISASIFMSVFFLQ